MSMSGGRGDRERLVVIGGDAAGMSAASQARRMRGPDELEIVAFERGHFTSYSACGIPYWVGGDVLERDQLIARTPEEHRAREIDVRMRTEVTEIDLDRRAVRARDVDSGAESWTGYDKLVIATGARPIRPDMPGWTRCRRRVAVARSSSAPGTSVWRWPRRSSTGASR